MWQMRVVYAVLTVTPLLACAEAGSPRVGLPGPLPESPANLVAAPLPEPFVSKRETLPLPSELLDARQPLTLAQIIDLGLRQSPETRATWHAARAAAAKVGSARAPYWPTLDASANLARSSTSALGGRFVVEQTTYGPSLSLSYLLLDFGGRGAGLDQARAALTVANWSHNAAVQQVILGVQQSYYDYADALARHEAATASLHEAETSLTSAMERLDEGVATQLEVLQARTALSQARLVQQQLSGRINSLKGALAVNLGLPANTPMAVEGLPTEVPVVAVNYCVAALIDQALTERPDLVAARANVNTARARVTITRASGLPALSLVGQAGRGYYEPHPYARYGDSWSAGLVLRIPLFSGLSTPYDVSQAESLAAVAEAHVDRLAQRVALEVWQSYYDVKTAGEAVTTAGDLVASASQAERVAAGRYQEGVGDFLDLLTAQSILASARATEIAARSDWFVSVARLAHAMGAASLDHFWSPPDATPR